MIITAAKIITCSLQGPLLSNKDAVVVFGGKIKAVGQFQDIRKKFPHHRVVQLQNAVLMPGLVNVHTHLELPPLLGRIRSRTFPGWVLNLIHAKKRLAAQDYQNAVIKNIECLIRTGTTAAGEICTHGISPALLKKSGLRAIVFREILGMGPLVRGKVPGNALIVRSGSRLVTSGYSPHAPYTVAEQLLRRINAVSKKCNIRIAMHVAESKDEIRLLQRKSSGLEKLYQFAHWDVKNAPAAESSFSYLNRIGLLNPRLLAVHAVQATDEDVTLIRNKKVSIAHCPRSNHEIGVGRMPLRKMLDAGIPVGLGTDSLASSPSLNLWDEMRYALHAHRSDHLTSQQVVMLATCGGARVLGMGDETGTIEPGKNADIIAVPLPRKDTGDIYADLIRETTCCIMNMVNGKLLYGPDKAAKRLLS